MRKEFLIIFLYLLCVACSQHTEEEQKGVPLLFTTPPSQKTGITFQNTLEESDSLNILDYLYFYNGGGVAVGDINNDGLADIYLSGNQVKNTLYLNKGNLHFEDITATAGVAGNSSWNTGSIFFDVNGDGLLDIYLRAVVGINGFQGHDELFINNGDNTFTERASQYNLAYQSYGTSAALLDYDKDGDLDIYQLNHAVHTQESFGKAVLRNTRNDKTGDRLLRNDQGSFTDVSEEVGIYGGINGYGLGVAVADFNQDGYPDIYVGNDFHEDDYYYINEEGVRFRESLKENFGHTSRFSMGNDVADINNDGFSDLISLDMLPYDEKVLKSSEGDDNIQTQRLRINRYGYHYQFTRNMLFVNRPGYQFQENALSSGVAATDWSWSSLFADFNNDGLQDIFIANGIPKRPNNLDFINFISNGQIQNRVNEARLIDQKALQMMPDGAAQNTFFKGEYNLTFTDVSTRWIPKSKTVSGATALADFDLDGDLDIIVNNSNAVAQLYVNQSETLAHSLSLRLKYKPQNKTGLGTKVYAYTDGVMQYKELYTARGFQASSDALVHFGLGDKTYVDSLRIIWPDNTYQVIKNVKADGLLTIFPEEARPFDYSSLQPEKTIRFDKVVDNLGIDFTHKEDAYLDFNRQKLIPYQVSDRGPATVLGDFNKDGLEDVYFGSSKFTASELYLGTESAFTKAYIAPLENLKKTEEKTATTIDNQLIIGTAGGDFSKGNPALIDYKLSFDKNKITKVDLPNQGNTSIIISNDYDQDGDLDLFVGQQVITGDYGTSPLSSLLNNDNGIFTIDTSNNLDSTGMVTDAVWSDFNADGIEDLILVGEWMEPLFYENRKGILNQVYPLTGKLNGLWQAIAPFDIDHDGDIDYLLGNWGTNSKFKASTDFPMLMYQADFDANGQSETVVTIEKEGKYYPIQNLQELASQLVYLKKKYKTNNDFAGQTVQAIFGKDILEESHTLTVHALSSGYLKNESGHFTFVPFDISMQLAPILEFLVYDFTGNGTMEALAGGNYFGTKPYHGRLDSFSGALIESEKVMTPGYKLGIDFAQKSVRHLNVMTKNNKSYLLVTYNNDRAEVYQINKY